MKQRSQYRAKSNARTAPRRLAPAFAAVVLLALLLPLCWRGPACAYEADHYVWTYYLALQVGFTKRQAFQIASGAYALDWWPITSPMEASTWDGLFGANHAVLGVFGDRKPALAYKWRDIHAFADEELVSGCNWASQAENPENQCGSTIMRRVQMQHAVMCSEDVAAKVEASREKQRKWLFGLAVQQDNPGALLHFTQTITRTSSGTTFVVMPRLLTCRIILVIREPRRSA